MPILPIITLFFTLMITFCKKTLHSFFDFAQYNLIHFSPNCSAGALSFVTFSAAHNHPPINSIESTAAMKPQPPSSPTTTSTSNLQSLKKDRSGIGFVDEVGGKVDGWMSCTESLGFESSDEWVGEKDVDNWINHRHHCGPKATDTATATPRKRKSSSSSSAKMMKSFPPPLSSLDGNGYPTFFLRPVRRDGRLELTGVRIDRPKLLASRQDGRLRLQLVLSQDVGVEDQVDDDAAEENKQNIDQQEADAEEEVVEEYKKQKEKDGCGGFRWATVAWMVSGDATLSCMV